MQTKRRDGLQFNESKFAPSSIEEIKTALTHKYKDSQDKRVKISGQTFYMSNDHVTYWDISRKRRDIHKNQIKKYLQNNKKLKPVNLMVAECDFLSWLGEDLPGDIIIMDIDQVLLDYINRLLTFIKTKYEYYQSGMYTFAEIKKIFNSFFKMQIKNENYKLLLQYRKSMLGRYNWLYNENQFKRCMNNLISRKVHTLNIDLFNQEETRSFSEMLQKANYVVPYINLTNLPDYDVANELANFLHSLPMPMNESARLIQWNIHDRGIDYLNEYDHYLRWATNVTEYNHCFQEELPLFLARSDFALILEKGMRESDIIKSKFKGILEKLKIIENVHGIRQGDFFKQYCLKFNEIFNDFCRKTKSTKKETIGLEGVKYLRDFINQLNKEISATDVLHVSRLHRYYLFDIYKECEKAKMILAPGILEILKLDAALAKEFADYLTLTSGMWSHSSEMTVKENVYKDLLFGRLKTLDGPLVLQKKSQLLTALADYKGEDCVIHISKILAKKNCRDAIKEFREIMGEVIVGSASSKSLQESRSISPQFFKAAKVSTPPKLIPGENSSKCTLL